MKALNSFVNHGISCLTQLYGIISLFSTHFCYSSNDDTFHHIDFYNRTSVNQLNTSCPLAFVVHGYFDGCSSGWTEELLRVWTDAECVNVCCVDWSVWAECNYWKCTGDYVQLVGEHLAETILFSATAYGMRTKSLVGHSLGAHVIGECGRNVNDPQVAECYCKFCEKKRNASEIRLVDSKFISFAAIDAAGVGYSQTRTNRPSRRIESSDCERVIALCCDKKVLGSDRTLGHLYVLVNNGTNQPQCEADDFSCDHSSCTSYFIESLRRNQSGSFTMINIETNATCVFNMESISECPDGNYTMTTSPCYPYVTT